MREARTILLTTEQENLLRWIVSRWKELPPGKRNFIAAANPDTGDFIELGGQRLNIDYSDLEELHEKRLVRYTERPQPHGGTKPVAERGAVTAEGLAHVDASAIVAPPREPDILLTDDQRELLMFLVEETRRMPKEDRKQFLATETMGGASFTASSGEHPVFIPDLYELDRKGLLRLRDSSQGISMFVVSPEGFVFYEQVKRFQGEAIQRVETETRYLLNRQPLEPYADAVSKWREAEDLLWRADAEEQLTTIGHKCREALQSFAQALYENHCAGHDPLPKEKTLNKIRAVLKTRRLALGETTEGFLNAYWAAVNDLAERAVHSSQQADRPLLWEDGRRVVFQTLSVLVELTAAMVD